MIVSSASALKLGAATGAYAIGVEPNLG